MNHFVNPPCPFLPEVDRVIEAREILALGDDRGPRFYEASLSYGQSQWRSGFPARALLQCNRALATYLNAEEAVLMRWPLPYSAMSWLMVHRFEDKFLGNPRRHFQHLATRMVEPHKELRVWRAWACWYLATLVLPEREYPADWKQIRQETLVEPTFAQISGRLKALSPANDHEAWMAAMEWSEPWHLRKAAASRPAVTIERAVAEDFSLVRDLAYAIWPRVYPGIITVEQIEYMLERRYDLKVLREDVHRGVQFAFVRVGNEVVGFTAFEPKPADGEAFLHKLYLLPEASGCGAGAEALKWVSEQARNLGMLRLRLFVNKYNAGAIRAYLRSGFTFDQDVVTDIGGGFVMDDFVMVKTLC